MSASYSRSQSAIPQMQPAAPMAKTSKVATFTSATLSKAATLKNRVLAPSANMVAYQPGHESLPVNRGDRTPRFQLVLIANWLCDHSTMYRHKSCSYSACSEALFAVCCADCATVSTNFLTKHGQCYAVLCSANVGGPLKAVLIYLPQSTRVKQHSGTDGLTLNDYSEMRT